MTDAQRVEPVWLDERLAMAIHDRQLAEHGGGVGVRDAGLLDSALARPLNRWGYGEDDPAVLAASYAFGVARNHPFVDGNRRTAWVLARVFLALNGHALASGHVTEDEMTEWFRTRLTAM